MQVDEQVVVYGLFWRLIPALIGIATLCV